MFIPVALRRLIFASMTVWPPLASAQAVSSSLANWELGAALAGLGVVSGLWLREQRKHRRETTYLHAIEAAFQESEARFERAAVGIALGTCEGRYLRANPQFLKITGYSESELLQRKVSELTHPADRTDNERLLAGLFEDGDDAASMEKRILRRDGDNVWVNASLSLVRSTHHANKFMEVIEDISARRHAEAVLRESESRLRTILGALEEGIVMHAADGSLLDCNDAIHRMFGMSREDFMRLSFDSGIVEFVHADGSPRASDTLPAIMAQQTGKPQHGLVSFRRNDEIRTLWVKSEPMRRDGQDSIYAIITTAADITESRANEARIAYLAHHDSLTGLPNRALLRDRLHQALVRAERERNGVALLCLDLDRFKTINDSLGHAAGDQLLRVIAERVQHCVRKSDTVCRQGGDEFIIVLQDLNEAEAPARVAEKVIERIAEPFEIDGQSITTSFSIGIAVYPNDGIDADSLVKNADTAMYHAKECGRNTYRFFTEAMNANALERLRLENQLRHALERGELVLHYQPQVSIADGSIVGAEALIRWNNPLLGLVPPARFIPIAEESGMILPIGAWVIREACRQARVWDAEGLPPIMMAVNLSALQFFRDDIVATVRNALRETGQPPELLELELTESLLMENTEEALSSIRQLKALGVRLAIDDFGIGYSCLSYLKRLAVDRLKIDQSFVRDVAHDADDAAIVSTLLQIG